MQLRHASLSDIELLIQLRLGYFKASGEKMDSDAEETIIRQLRSYFTRHIPLGDFVAFLAEVDGKVASVAFLCIFEKPANPYYISGITGSIFNVFTYPEYEKKGLATQNLHAIMEYAKKLGASSIDLIATQQGYPLYKKLGFSELNNTTMRRPL